MNDEPKKISVIVVDDHALFRMGVKATFQYDYPDIVIAGEAGNGGELFCVLAQTEADLVLLDINLPDMSGVEITQRVRSDYPNLKILAVSAEDTAETVTAMLEAGIHGFITKQNGNADELTQAIRTVMSGLEYFGRDIAAIIYDVYISKKKTATITDEFTDREREIILLCRDGLIGKEIADRLSISINTVNYHKKNIFSKLGINNTMEMVKFALKKGIIKVEN
jgi:two-component system response regulator NreC